MRERCHDRERTFYIKAKGARVEKSLGVDSQQPSSATRQSHSDKKENVESRPYDDESSDSRPSFMEAVNQPHAPWTDAFNKVNASLYEALAQNPRALRKIARSPKDKLAACAGNTAEPSDMPVPLPFTPLGQKASEGAKTKTSLTVMGNEETEMETDAPHVFLVQCGPPVPLPQPATPKDKEPCMVDEAGMKKWSNDMLKGHPAGRATTWEQLSNSLALQFKGAMDIMSQSLRIKEDT